MFIDIKPRITEAEVGKIIALAAYDGTAAGVRQEGEKYLASDVLHFYGWVADGQVLGICGFEVHRDKLEIHLIAVAERRQHRGIGAAMVQALQDMYPLALEAETVAEAVGFYRKTGFAITPFPDPEWGEKYTCRLPYRCLWARLGDNLMREYHDTQWGKPCFDEATLFEMLTLEGAQAGLSWSCVLHKRENYRAAFDHWEIGKIAGYNEAKVAQLLANPGIIRNRRKIYSTVQNAQAVLRLGSLSDFIWGYVNGQPIVNQWTNQAEMPAKTALSDTISKDMKKLGFSFVGSTIVYSYLQAIGVVNDHLTGCAFR